MLEGEARYQARRWLAAPEVWIEDLKEAATAWGCFQAYPGHRALREAASGKQTG